MEVSDDTLPQDLYVIGHEHVWNYFTSIYFIFTTVTCIGFGDLYLYNVDPHTLILKTFVVLIFQSVLIGMLSYMFKVVSGDVEHRSTLTISTKHTQTAGVSERSDTVIANHVRDQIL